MFSENLRSYSPAMIPHLVPVARQRISAQKPLLPAAVLAARLQMPIAVLVQAVQRALVMDVALVRASAIAGRYGCIDDASLEALAPEVLLRPFGRLVVKWIWF